MKKLVFVLAFFSMAALPAADMLVNVSEEPANGGCSDKSGVKIEIGEDSNENGTLDSGEVDTDKTQYVCNGSNGSATLISITTENPGGACGTAGGVKITAGSNDGYVCNGEPGKNALMKTSEIDAGEGGCSNGGVKIEVGIDKNGNGVLDSNNNEIISAQTKYVCKGNDGDKGHNALAKVSDISDEEKEAECNGNDGVKIETGTDTNDNDTLDAEEITGTPQYVCNGKNGSNQGKQGPKGEDALSRTSEEPAGSNCENGGIKIEVGNDSNRDRVLDDNEVIAEQTKYVCNGVQGQKGETGQKGERGEQGETGATGESGRNGTAALVSVVNEPKGANCAAGGKKIETGLDANGNGTLDEDEIDPADIHYVCNGRDAQEAGLSSSSGCAMTTVDGGFNLIYALMAAVAAFFAFFAAKIIRR